MCAVCITVLITTKTKKKMKKSRKPKATETKPDAELTGSTMPPAFTPSEIERWGKRLPDGVILSPDVNHLFEFDPTALDPIQVRDWLVVDCLPEIGRYFYMGDNLLHVNENTPPDELIETGITLYGEGPDAVLPGLKVKIEAMLGKGNFDFMCWEIGQHHLTLNWLLNIDVYNEVVELISGWLRYEELDGIVALDCRA